MTGALISADSPSWWQLSPATAVNPPSSRYSKLTSPKTLRGISAIEMNIIGLSSPPRESSTAQRFDPMTSTTSTLIDVPDKPGRAEKLYALELNQPRARVTDPISFNSRHRDVIEREKRAFFRTKGFMESYLEDANTYRDFLVWQASHPRGYTRGNNPSNFKPSNDFYDFGGDTKDTHRKSMSRLMVNRHLTSRNSTGASGSRSMKASLSEPVLMKKVVDPPVTRVLPSPRSRLSGAAQKTLNELEKFERTHHHLSGIEDMTKEELIQLIEKEGVEMPGERVFDPDTNTVTIKKLKKKEYLEFVRQKLFSMDDKPMVKKGKKLGKNWCIVSVFKSRKGGVRICAYDTTRSMDYHLFLGAPMLEDLDIRKCPAEPVIEVDPYAFRDWSKTDEQLAEEKRLEEERLHVIYMADWEDWSANVIERLVLTPQGDLVVGPAKLMANGLSKNFCLTGRDIVDKERAKDLPPSRVHIQKWFDMK